MVCFFMKTINTLFLAGAVLAAAPSLEAQIAVGDQPTFSFREAVFNGMGATSLADFQGKPLLIDFWGTR
jgi:hypothetical protein